MSLLPHCPKLQGVTFYGRNGALISQRLDAKLAPLVTSANVRLGDEESLAAFRLCVNVQKANVIFVTPLSLPLAAVWRKLTDVTLSVATLQPLIHAIRFVRAFTLTLPVLERLRLEQVPLTNETEHEELHALLGELRRRSVNRVDIVFFYQKANLEETAQISLFKSKMQSDHWMRVTAEAD